jgi:hypothetical protein
MPRTGQPAYDTGMRGKEKPRDKRTPEPAPGKAKTPIKRLSIEKGDTGYRIDVERHSPPPKKGKDGKPDYDPMQYEHLHESHHHTSKDSAVAHHTALMDELGGPPGGAGGGPAPEKVSSAG